MTEEIDPTVEHNLRKMGAADCLDFFRGKKLDLETLRSLSSLGMLAIFKDNVCALSKFEKKFKQMRPEDWEIPETQFPEQSFGGGAGTMFSTCWMKLEVADEDPAVADPLDIDTNLHAESETENSEARDLEDSNSDSDTTTVGENSENRKRYLVPSRPAAKRVTFEREDLPSETDAPENAKNIVAEYLSRNLQGKAALKAGKAGKLDESVRAKVCHEIILGELGDDQERSISRSRFLFLTKCIVELFPKETASFYYTPRVQKNGTTPAVQPKGILYDKYHNFLRYLRKYGLRTSIRGKAQDSEVDVDDDDLLDQSAKKDIDWLQKNSLVNKERTAQKWEATSDYRQNLLWNNVCRKSKSKLQADKVATYFAQFECLRQPWGLELILKDFDAWFSGKAIDLLENWPLVSQKLKTFLKVEETLEDNEQAFMVKIIHAIPKKFKQPLMLSKITKKEEKKKTWKPNVQESVNGLLLYVKTIQSLETEIAGMKKRCDSVNRPLQPFPAIVGPSLNNVTSCYIVVDDVKYSVESPLMAFDGCFKLYQALHCSYPVQSNYSWQFVQRVMYDLSTDFDELLPSVDKAVNDYRRL